MKQRTQAGFTLIELMIAVAVLGILTGIMIVGFGGQTRKVKTTSEANGMFAEFHRAQSQHALEHGVYFSTGDDDGDIFPTTPGAQSQEVGILPAEWDTLRIKPTSPKLYCGYVTVAGTSDDDIPSFAEDFGMEQPATNWYVVYARCNADGNSTVDAEYFTSSFDNSLQKRNDGR